MPGFEEEAFKRAQQMHSSMPYYHNSEQQEKRQPKREQKPEHKPEPEKPRVAVKQSENKENLLDIMFKNKDQTLILLLIVLLMEDDAEPTLLLALMYLLL